MSAFEKALVLEPNAGQIVLNDDDRRSNDRAKLLKQICIRAAGVPNAEETGTLIDLSRDGLYFTGSSADYRVGMEVCLTLPHSGAQCTCEIVRIEQLPQGRFGFGARITAW
jgi:hypothetical protein